jgi:hypothetical protein
VSRTRRVRWARRAGIALAALAVASAAAFSATRPDPHTDAVADGCERNPIGLYTAESPNWAYVGDRSTAAGEAPPPPQWVRGVVNSQFAPWLAVHPTGVDNPFTHASYDMVVNVDPDPAYEFLLGGNPGAATGNFEGAGESAYRLHTEWESAAFGRFAWPDRGDRVELLGSWVWDCDHFAGGGERTELHPLRAVVVHRGPSPTSLRGETETDVLVSTDATPAAVQAECAHRTKHDRAAFKTCVRGTTPWQDVSGSYRFFVRAPARPSARARMTVRVRDHGSAGGVRVQTARARGGVWVSFRIPAQRGRRVVVAKQVLVGWTPLPARSRPVRLRVSFRSLLVRRAMDPGCPGARERSCGSAQTTLGQQVSQPPGEWVVYWNVGGVWGTWAPVVLRARDGAVFRGGQSVDVYVPRAAPWRVFVFARECDFGTFSLGRSQPVAPCPRSGEVGDGTGDDTAGSLEVRFRSPAASLGLHTVDSRLAGSSCPPVNRRGCFRVAFDVARVG